MVCHRILDISPNQLIEFPDRISKNMSPAGFGVTFCDPASFFYEDIYNQLLKLGNPSTLVFQQKYNIDKGNIHIDMAYDNTPYWPALNIILEGQGVMKWFNPPGPGIVKISPLGVRYKMWPAFQEYGQVIDEWRTGKVALVRTDTPHNVWNPDQETRLMATTRWQARMTWEETNEWFEKNIIPLRKQNSNYL